MPNNDDMEQSSERQLMELAFRSANAIVDLAELSSCVDLKALQERVIRGELTFDEAVQLVIGDARSS
jgi:hypothetical protein